MRLHSCQNCWFNGLQYGALGLAVGYCSRHKKILNVADGTTCGLHLRKDLSVNRAKEISIVHHEHYTSECVSRIVDAECCEPDVSDSDKDKIHLRKDAVAGAALDYGELGSTIESLAELKALPGARAELAMLSLGRAYVSNCMSRNGKWTSGLHMYWWSRGRLADMPEIKVEDLRSVGATNLARQSDLTAWSLVMLRVTFIEDITTYAGQQNDPLGKVDSLTEQAALSMDTFNLRNLKKWLTNEAAPQLDARLSHDRYVELATKLHKDRENGEAQQGA
ncbi:MAG: hypothetical protein U5S82_16260 [Gammaproteobacteria bacterium]|nr:hypothetical protein [Gammaproteobacteria bacterium]